MFSSSLKRTTIRRARKGRYYALAREVGSVRDRGGNVLGFQSRVLLENALLSLARGQVIEYHGHGNARSTQAQGSVHDIGAC